MSQSKHVDRLPMLTILLSLQAALYGLKYSKCDGPADLSNGELTDVERHLLNQATMMTEAAAEAIGAIVARRKGLPYCSASQVICDETSNWPLTCGTLPRPGAEGCESGVRSASRET